MKIIDRIIHVTRKEFLNQQRSRQETETLTITQLKPRSTPPINANINVRPVYYLEKRDV